MVMNIYACNVVRATEVPFFVQISTQTLALEGGLPIALILVAGDCGKPLLEGVGHRGRIWAIMWSN